MYRDESETHLDDGHSHNFATAFLRNLRCSAVTIEYQCLGVSDC